MARNKLPEILTREETQNIFKQINRRYIRGIRNYAIYKLLCNSGLRNAELCGLRNKDINFAEPSVMVKNGKGGKDRKVDLPEEIMVYIKDWIAEKNRLGLDSKWLFCSYRKFNNDKGLSDQQLTTRYLQLALKGYIKKAGIDEDKNIHVHSLRHTYATEILRVDGNLVNVMNLLGHSNIQTTMIYQHMSNKDTRSAVQKLTAF